MIQLETENAALRTFKKRKVMTVPQLAELLNCSIPTVRMRLREWRTYTSYNKNGRYYSLPSIPEFDENGLWKYRDIIFSQHGNLKLTVIHLVKNSPMGLDASEIGKRLGLLPRSFMSHFRKMPGLYRERHQGRFIYFSDEESVFLKQKHSREQALEKRHTEIPSDTDAVSVLADFIKHPNSSLEACSRRLKKKGIDIHPEAIRSLLDYHGIKKTAGMNSSGV